MSILIHKKIRNEEPLRKENFLRNILSPLSLKYSICDCTNCSFSIPLNILTKLHMEKISPLQFFN